MGKRIAFCSLAAVCFTLFSPFVRNDAAYAVPAFTAYQVAINEVDVSNTGVTIEQYKRLQIAFPLAGMTPGVNYRADINVYVEFSGETGAAREKHYSIWGFWDGGNTWKVRFAPTFTGAWRWTAYLKSESSGYIDPYITILTDTFSVVAPSGEYAENILSHGFLKRDESAWKLSDGTPFLPIGDTQFSFAEEIPYGDGDTSDWHQWLNARQLQKFNTFLGSVWICQFEIPSIGKPFVGYPVNNAIDVSSYALNPGYFYQLDQKIKSFNDHGIMVGLIIGGFPSSIVSSWFSRFTSDTEEDWWFKYVVRRYAAFNVRWGLYGEVEQSNPDHDLKIQDKLPLIREQDPYSHPIGSHHGGGEGDLYDGYDLANVMNPKINYVDIESHNDTYWNRDTNQYVKFLKPELYPDLHHRKYNKPYWFEESWYETYDDNNAIETSCVWTNPITYDTFTYRISYKEGINNAHRNFVAAMGFMTVGTLMRAHDYENYRDKCFGSGKTYSGNMWSNDPGAVKMEKFAKFYGWAFDNPDIVNDLEPYTGLDLGHFTPESYDSSIDNIVWRPGLVGSAPLCGKFGESPHESYAIYLEGGGNVLLSVSEGTRYFKVKRLNISDGTVSTGGGYITITAGTPHQINSYSTENTVILVLDLGAYNDYTPPDKPPSLDYSILQNGTVNLTWTTIEDPESYNSMYNIYRGGKWIGESREATFTDNVILPAGTYNYRVSAMNSKRLESEKSDPREVTIE